MRLKAEQYIDTLIAKGEIAFSFGQFCRELNINHNAGSSIIHRLKQQKKIIFSCSWLLPDTDT